MTADSCPASLYDGRIALRRDGAVERAGGALVFVDERGGREGIDIAMLFPLDERAGRLVYGDRNRDGWRLLVDAPPPDAIAALLPATERYGRLIDRWGLAKALPVLAGLSALVLLAVLTAPGWLAPLIPIGVERNIGIALAADFPGERCRGEAGQAALSALAAKLDDAPRDLDIEVVDSDIVNAAALPGGKVVLFRGLLEEARSPDEVAGVLAHEIGHVRERHVMQALLQQLGLAAVLSGTGTAGDTASGLLSLRYSRGAEREADRWSIRTMKMAHISPKDTADFFARMAKDESDWTGYIATHPMSRERRDRFAKSADAAVDYAPALDAGQWKALQVICD